MVGPVVLFSSPTPGSSSEAELHEFRLLLDHEKADGDGERASDWSTSSSSHLARLSLSLEYFSLYVVERFTSAFSRIAPLSYLS
jgi:hypothetical protein